MFVFSSFDRGTFSIQLEKMLKKSQVFYFRQIIDLSSDLPLKLQTFYETMEEEHPTPDVNLMVYFKYIQLRCERIKNVFKPNGDNIYDFT